ncbi:eCIS core domain-containing protein [Teredinibacter purpureus]|uniref:eCIS core domain-containing protein n=1 Tax=Teredinibacter purpureus TaxID=2731756 RepID=UPI0009E26435|nr:DUF4157 domain-containing protein [Teredinibacter purpureus]
MHTYAKKKLNNNPSTANEPEKKTSLETTDTPLFNSSEILTQSILPKIVNNVTQPQQTTQLHAMANILPPQKQQAIQHNENNTGLPENLKSGIENLSGFSMNDVKVHYNSDKPAQLQAHAYAQGSKIYLGKGQEKHLPHEAWHVVQQRQGRVKPTIQMKGETTVNDDKSLEKEADVMGAKALLCTHPIGLPITQHIPVTGIQNNALTAQLKGTKITHKTTNLTWNGKKGIVGAEAEAKMDPNDIVYGSAVDPSHARYTDLDRLAARCNSGAWARGHLLSHDLGGLGVPENLFPITKGANRRHAHFVEYRVKDALSIAKEQNKVAGVDDSVYYKVAVRGNPSDAQFVCEWAYRDKNDQEKSLEGLVPSGKFIIPSKLKGPKAGGAQPATDPYYNCAIDAPSADYRPTWFHGDRKGGEAANSVKVTWHEQDGLSALMTQELADQGHYAVADGTMSAEQIAAQEKLRTERMLAALGRFLEERGESALVRRIISAVFSNIYRNNGRDWNFRTWRNQADLTKDYGLELGSAISDYYEIANTELKNNEEIATAIESKNPSALRTIALTIIKATLEYEQLIDRVIAAITQQEQDKVKDQQIEQDCEHPNMNPKPEAPRRRRRSRSRDGRRYERNSRSPSPSE